MLLIGGVIRSCFYAPIGKVHSFQSKVIKSKKDQWSRAMETRIVDSQEWEQNISVKIYATKTNRVLFTKKTDQDFFLRGTWNIFDYWLQFHVWPFIEWNRAVPDQYWNITFAFTKQLTGTFSYTFGNCNTGLPDYLQSRALNHV